MIFSFSLSTQFPPIFLLFIPRQRRLKNLNGTRTCTGYLEGVFYESTGCNLVPRLNLSLGWNRVRTKIPPLPKAECSTFRVYLSPSNLHEILFHLLSHLSFISFPPGLFIYSPLLRTRVVYRFTLVLLSPFSLKSLKRRLISPRIIYNHLREEERKRRRKKERKITIKKDSLIAVSLFEMETVS